MTLWVDVARVAIGVNLLLLALLGYVWGTNYLKLRSKHTLGLVVFAAFLLGENILAMYFYLFHPVLRVWVSSVPSIAQFAMTALRLCETGGLAFLAWISLD